MLRVGLTGGLASGKSFVGRTLRDMGCYLVQADELGHQVVMPGQEAYQAVLDEFGEGLLTANGEIDRRKLASLVFGEPERLARLNALIHPHVIARQERITEAAGRRDPSAIVVVEAAILVETGSYKRFQKLILTVCDAGQQIVRAMERDGITREQAEIRLARQMPLEEKRKYADFVVDTSGTKQQTYEQVRELYRTLREIPQ